MFAFRIFILGLAALAAGPVFAQGCRFKGPVLYCLDGDRSLEAVVSRFADDDTTSLLKSSAEDFDRFEALEDREARERYRVSVERNNARSVKYAKEADRLSRSGQIDGNEYRRRMNLYRAAYANYRLAIDRYAEAYWFDPVQDAPEGGDGVDDTVTAKG